MINKNNKYLLLFIFIIFSNILNAIKLSEINGMNELENYNEIKNIEVERVVNFDNYDRDMSKNLIYVHGETQPFTGLGIKRNNKNKILHFLHYKNGKKDGIFNEYYENGKLKNKRNVKNDKMMNLTGYYENGKLKYTIKSVDGVNAVLTSYYESGIKSGEKEIIQDYSQAGKINYIANGKALVYDKKGNLFGELQLRNNSTVGQKQKFYENNRLKYEFIAGSELNEPAKPSQYYIEYYDNSDKVAMHCEEKPSGSWTCKEYKKDGTFKREKDYSTVIYKQRGTKDWINYLLPVLKVFGL